MGKIGTNKGKKFSEEWKNKISNSLMGKSLSSEHIKHLSESHIGNIAANRKLTLEQVREIRNRYNTTKITQKELGKQYGLSQATINDIVRNLTYREAQNGETKEPQ
jgi:DNA-binding MarR family transcriptional regulator